jgi:hypothetical protein
MTDADRRRRRTRCRVVVDGEDPVLILQRVFRQGVCGDMILKPIVTTIRRKISARLRATALRREMRGHRWIYSIALQQPPAIRARGAALPRGGIQPHKRHRALYARIEAAADSHPH